MGFQDKASLNPEDSRCKAHSRDERSSARGIVCMKSLGSGVYNIPRGREGGRILFMYYLLCHMEKFGLSEHRTARQCLDVRFNLGRGGVEG